MNYKEFFGGLANLRDYICREFQSLVLSYEPILEAGTSNYQEKIFRNVFYKNGKGASKSEIRAESITWNRMRDNNAKSNSGNRNKKPHEHKNKYSEESQAERIAQEREKQRLELITARENERKNEYNLVRKQGRAYRISD